MDGIVGSVPLVDAADFLFEWKFFDGRGCNGRTDKETI